MAGHICIGISGWRYPPWRGVFFPKGWPQKRELEYASQHVNSIEINGSFYSLQRPSSYIAWYDATPEGFIFSIKGGRYITHQRRLKEVEIPLANFFASGLLCLKEKLGPILWQLPPSLTYDPETVDSFLRLLPPDTEAAAQLARQHDDKVTGRMAIEVDEKRPLRHTMEVRHASFQTPEFVAQLREYNVGLVVADTAGKWPLMEDVTSDFVYIRLHGDEKLYVSGYTDPALKEWGRKIKAWAKGKNPVRTQLTAARTPSQPSGRNVYVYFDNDVKVRAPFDAMSLAHQLGLSPPPKEPETVEKVSDYQARRSWPSLQRME